VTSRLDRMLRWVVLGQRSI